MSTRIGIIGGTGIGERIRDEFHPEDARTAVVDTPFGKPSADVMLATIDTGTGPVQVAVLPRHGEGHRLPPHRVPYRANIYAMKSLGVTHLLATSACGSLREHIHPGSLAIPDQVIDRTMHRARTFFDDLAVHVEFAEPFCPLLRQAVLHAGRTLEGVEVHDHATMMVMEGPAFSTRAESEMHRTLGADLIAMTAMPEARLAREAEIAYALIALPTDYDCWRPKRAQDDASLLTEIRQHLVEAGDAAFALIRAVLRDAHTIAEHPSPAHRALDHAIWTARDVIDADTRKELGVLLDRALG
ncbi:MAG: S-methyl-5'-thioadenosine phosphorylase [Phycisphaerales bacterium]